MEHSKFRSSHLMQTFPSSASYSGQPQVLGRMTEQSFHSPCIPGKWNEVRQSIQLPSFLYSLPGLQMQLLWVAEPSSAVLPFGQGVHSLSENSSLKVCTGHFMQFAPVPVLRCFHTGLKRLNKGL